MIDLFFFPSPNTWKVSIALEELGEPYRIVPVDITAGAQDEPAFRAISPNGRVPAIRDSASGETLFESGAILLWLAERSGRLLPREAHYPVLLGGRLYARILNAIERNDYDVFRQRARTTHAEKLALAAATYYEWRYSITTNRSASRM